MHNKTKSLKINALINAVYLKWCRSVSPIGYTLYSKTSEVIGPGFKNFAFRLLEKLFRLASGFNKSQRYTTYRNLKLNLSFDDAFYSGLLFYGVIDTYETKVLESILKKGDTVFDAGAFVDGWYTLFPALLVGNSGHVYSFEPSPEYFSRVKENIALNGLKNITLLKKGLYDKEKSMTFYIAQGRSSVIKKQAESYIKTSAPKVTIKTTTIDNFVRKKKIKRVDLIKIDVEGAELNVLKGAKKTLNNMHPNLIIEIVDEQLRLGGTSKKEVFSYLKNLGYFPYSFTAKGLISYKENQPRKTDNIYFTTKKLF